MPGRLAPIGDLTDRERAGVDGEDGSVARGRLDVGEQLALDLQILEHRLDHHLGALESAQVGGGGDAGEGGVGRASLPTALPDPGVEQRTHRGQCMAHRGVVALLDAHGEPGALGADERDAGAHQPAAEDADLLHRPGPGTTVHAAVLLERSGGEEELAEPVAHVGGEQLTEGAGLGVESRFHPVLEALADRVQGALRCRVVSQRLAQQLLLGLGEQQASAERVALQRGAGDGLARRAVAPHGVLATEVRLRMLDGDVDQDGDRHHLVDQAELLGLRRPDRLPAEDDVQRFLDADEPWQSLRAASAWHEPELHLGQPELRARRVGGDASAAGQRPLQSTAQAGAVDGGDDRLLERREPVELRVSVA